METLGGVGEAETLLGLRCSAERSSICRKELPPAELKEALASARAAEWRKFQDGNWICPECYRKTP
jgi:hypothetical protein